MDTLDFQHFGACGPVVRMMHPNSLANLAAPFEKGHAPARVNTSVRRAIMKCKRLAPEMIDIAARVARDTRESTKDRLRAIDLILRQAIPSVHGGNGMSPIRLDANASCLRIEIVDPHTDNVLDVTPRSASTPNGVDADSSVHE